MKTRFTLLLCCIILAFQGYSQKKKDKYIYASSTLNFYPIDHSDFSFYASYDRNSQAFNFTFITADSGTFVVQETAPILVELNTYSGLPNRRFSIGASFQIRGASGSFSEISLTRLSNSKSSFLNNYTYNYSSGDQLTFVEGYEQRSTVLSLRYEYGRMFGRSRDKARIGISGVLEPGFFHYRKTSFQSNEFPIRANIYSLNFGIAPIFAFRLSKKVFLDFKVIPTMQILEWGSTRILNPILPIQLQRGSRVDDLPQVDIRGTVQLRYMLKEPRKRRRKRKSSN